MSVNNNSRPLPGTYFTNTTALSVLSKSAGNPWVGEDDLDRIGCNSGKSSTPYDPTRPLDQDAIEEAQVILSGMTALRERS
jgi:hypothetical protein